MYGCVKIHFSRRTPYLDDTPLLGVVTSLTNVKSLWQIGFQISPRYQPGQIARLAPRTQEQIYGTRAWQEHNTVFCDQREHTLRNEVGFSASQTNFLFSQVAERSPPAAGLVQIR